MTDHFDEREIQDPDAREEDLGKRLAGLVRYAVNHAPGWARHLADAETDRVDSRAALAKLPVLRKSDLAQLQAEDPPFGGFVAGQAGPPPRVFVSPGPIYEPQGIGPDPANASRALYAAGLRAGGTVHNAFSYHLTPGGWMLDEGARALGATVVPAGVGNTEQQAAAVAALKPDFFCGVPDFLKVLLDKGAELGLNVSSITRGLVSGAALPASLRAELDERGVRVVQAYATAELGVIAYESEAREGLIVNEDVIVEILRPGTGDPVPEGEVGEVVVTRLSSSYPLIRFATGDLSAALPGQSPCGRTAPRIKGWMGRADQRTKIKGMFVDPAQIDALVKRHPEVRRARLVVARSGEQDVMTLSVETEAGSEIADRLEESLRDLTKLSGRVDIVAPGTLPNDGKVIADDRPVG
ncbi:phenylacetate--CoA ligase family protein [Amorphus orientalis]|uniref:Phenylacetate-CoA ligase n=1 Tax=Amorphus orientalis TaxID=649198 RepID=A0AAE4ATR6_9HYPH|nr:AMP-binding protein [Amorphus orientalis]MDQ0316603.1 phenylacetate-CoA ligase [Amorphus orientalis]